jgi:mannosyltransferase
MAIMDCEDASGERMQAEPALDTPTAQRLVSWLCVLGVAIVALLARLHGIGDKPFWMDEITTLQRSGLSLWGIINDSLSFHHLPAYFVLESWLVPFGNTEIVLRLPSALFGTVSCLALFGVGRSLGGLRAGVLAGLLMALSPLQVQYGQEARSYAMVTCLISIALWGLVKLACNPQAASRRWRDPAGAQWAWAAYGLGTLAAMNVLSVALFWLLAANLAAPAIARHRDADRRRFLSHWWLVNAGIVLVSLPWFVAMYFATRTHLTEGLDWIPPLNPARLWSAIASVYLMRHSSLISLRLLKDGVPLLALVVAVLGTLGLLHLARRRTTLIVLVLALFTLPLSLLVLSFITPVWMPRFVLWSAAPFFALAGTGLALLPRRWQMPVMGAVVVTALVNLTPYYREETKPRWDLAAATLQAGLQEDDLVLVDDPWAVKMMNVYLSRIGADLPPESWTVDRSVAQERLNNGGQVWAVHGRVGQADKESVAEFRGSLAALGQPAAAMREGLDVLVVQFHPTTPERHCAPGWRAACGWLVHQVGD